MHLFCYCCIDFSVCCSRRNGEEENVIHETIHFHCEKTQIHLSPIKYNNIIQKWYHLLIYSIRLFVLCTEKDVNFNFSMNNMGTMYCSIYVFLSFYLNSLANLSYCDRTLFICSQTTRRYRLRMLHISCYYFMLLYFIPLCAIVGCAEQSTYPVSICRQTIINTRMTNYIEASTIEF